MTPQELKNSILQRAIQGRLVPQEPTDEPASVLLDKIRKEKAKLIKAGNIRKEQSFPPISEEEMPFEIPEGWSVIRIGDVGVYKKGPFGSSITKSMFVPKGPDAVKVYEQKNAIQKDHTLGEYYIRRSYFNEKLQGFEVFPGDVIVSCAGTIGETYVMPDGIEQGIINQALMRMKIVPSLNLDYFLLYFDYVLKKSAHGSSKGSAIKNIPPFDVFKKMVLPLPPLSEQRRIVSKLEELLPLVESYAQAWNRLEELNRRFPDDMRKAILQHAIQGRLVPQDPTDEPASVLLDKIRKEKAKLIKAGKIKKEKPLPEIPEEEIPFDIPENWTWVRLGDACNYGQCINAEPSDIPAGYWVLDLEDIEKDTGRVLQKKKKEEVKAQSTKHLFKKGDVLYSKLRPYLNKVVLADSDGCCTSEILPLKFGSFIFAPYAQMYLMSPEFIAYTMRFSYGMKMPRLGTMDGKLALFPLPPLAEQKRIVSKLEELLPLCDQLKQRIA